MTWSLGCIADRTTKARRALAQLLEQYPAIRDLSPLLSATTASDLDPSHLMPPDLDMLIVLGGDGFMLHSLHRFMDCGLPFYGMNSGTIGFLMNSFKVDGLYERLASAKTTGIHPLRMQATCQDGRVHKALAINEVSLLRQTNQAAKIRISIDQHARIHEMISDGVLVATSAGSSAYNLSAGGTIIPLGANVLALTPINPFRPRRWRGALLPHNAHVTLTLLEPTKRPVSAVADFYEVRHVVHVDIREDHNRKLRLLFDPDHSLEERIFKEQFVH